MTTWEFLNLYVLATISTSVVAYAADDLSVEHLVVRGYLAECNANASLKDFTDKDIEVPYSVRDGQPAFPEDKAVHKGFFDYQPDSSDNWASSFYRSLSQIDAAILVGGSQSTFIAGTVSISHRKPIAPTATYGSAAARLWQELAPEPGLVERKELGLLASPIWDQKMVDTMVESARAETADWQAAPGTTAEERSAGRIAPRLCCGASVDIGPRDHAVHVGQCRFAAEVIACSPIARPVARRSLRGCGAHSV